MNIASFQTFLAVVQTGSLSRAGEQLNVSQSTVTARLNLRHLPPSLLDEIGTPHLKPLLEIVVIDEKQALIDVH